MTDDLLRQIISVGRVDLLVGAPHGADLEATRELVRATRACFRTHFPRLLAAADLLQARSVVFIDPHTIELTPQRIALLAAPLTDDSVDLIAPVHPLAADAGLLVTQLVRPLTRGLLGSDVREPLLPALGASARLTTQCMQLDFS